ncbi:MAG TPA: hypothetical protein ENN19_11145, partial [Chloroflexi bacterium]|nr:hypothetical protein [Chloroflexota bacterium]
RSSSVSRVSSGWIGPVVLQETVPIQPEDTLETLEERIHAIEHRLMIQAIRDLVDENNRRGEMQ